MPPSNPDDSLLLIRCPSCGQRFKVGDDLKGRTVECGGCEHRFRINDEVIVRGRKFYPGERKDPGLNRFQRVPLSFAPMTPPVQMVQYADPPDPANFEPTPPLRILAGLVAVVLMVFIALLLILGAHRGGALDGMTTFNRLLMAGFTGLLGMALLVYANRRAKFKAFFLGLLMASGLVSLPFFFDQGSIPLDQVPRPSTAAQGKEIETPHAPVDPDEDLKTRIGTGPLEAEILRLEKEGSTRKAVGLWLRDLRETNRLLVRDYLLRTLNADPQSHYYPRGDGDFLMVITGINQSLSEVTSVVAALGSIEKTYPRLSVIEVKINNESFIEGSIEKMNNKKDPAFYDLNKRELESIDLERVSKAVKRLADAEPTVYRADITRKLLALMGADWVDFKGDVARALVVWSETPGPAGEAGLASLRKMMEKAQAVPVDLVALIVKEKNLEVIPILEQLWAANPTQWEELFGAMGTPVEAVLLKRFTATVGALRQSSVRLLGKVGGPESLPVLEGAAASADPELKVLIEKSVHAIRSRMAP